MKRAVALFFTLAAPVLLKADPLLFNYSHISPHSLSYPDSGGELNDGNAANIAWGGGNSISFADVAGLVGWDFNPPVITCTFDSPVNITSVVAWFADSNGAAGVGLPSSITLSDGAGFSQVFIVADPDGSGSTIPITLDGFSLTTSTLTLSAERAYQWTMASEIEVFGTTAIPEPSAYAAALGGFTLVAAVGSRRRRASRL